MRTTQSPSCTLVLLIITTLFLPNHANDKDSNDEPRILDTNPQLTTESYKLTSQNNLTINTHLLLTNNTHTITTSANDAFTNSTNKVVHATSTNDNTTLDVNSINGSSIRNGSVHLNTSESSLHNEERMENHQESEYFISSNKSVFKDGDDAEVFQKKSSNDGIILVQSDPKNVEERGAGGDFETPKGFGETGNSDGDMEDRQAMSPERREIDAAMEYGIGKMNELYFVKEPELYKMGLFLDENDPASRVAAFSAPSTKAQNLGRYGYAALQASTKLAEIYPRTRQAPGASSNILPKTILEDCPLLGHPRCPSSSARYRTADGSCNNPKNSWLGASMLPMQRFLRPAYDDAIQSVRRSVLGGPLPSPRTISTRIHTDKNRETPSVTLMFMQFGQFLDHDIIASAQARAFNRSIPRCCERGGIDLLPPELTHPECLPISVSEHDPFYSQFGVRCLEFVRNAPATRIDCDLGWREQINQVTSFIDASTVYGSDTEMAESIRLFKKGKLIYGRPLNQGRLQPPDPPQGELCRSGALTTDCFEGGDFRRGEQPALTAIHTAWLRYHNRLAQGLAKLNSHWSDEKLYQETRRIVGAFMQHITYREFLPIVLGSEVTNLFNITLVRKGYYHGYNIKINPAPANSFGSAAFRFGHSLVQNSFIRTDHKHRPIFNNVSLHEEQDNVENIWSLGSVDRLILGLCNQPSQRRDEFMCEELTNHLFQSKGFPFGMDLAAINIQRGRDHGLPSYTHWREPCGLAPIKKWSDLEKIMSISTVKRFRSLYKHIDDIDLFPAGLAEKPVRGGIVGPTFACIIAQQFSNVRKGDRFWYENGNFESSFTPAQLQQIRKITFANILCKTMDEIETLQTFVFLSPDSFKNARISCDSATMDHFDLSPWEENQPRKTDKLNDDYEDEFEVDDDKINFKDDDFAARSEDFDEMEIFEGRKKTSNSKRKKNKRKHSNTTTRKPIKSSSRPPISSTTRPLKTNFTSKWTDLENKHFQLIDVKVPTRQQITYVKPNIDEPVTQRAQYYDSFFYPQPISTSPYYEEFTLNLTNPSEPDVVNKLLSIINKPKVDQYKPARYQFNINIQYSLPNSPIPTQDEFYSTPIFDHHVTPRPAPEYSPTSRRPVYSVSVYEDDDSIKHQSSTNPVYGYSNNDASYRPSYSYDPQHIYVPDHSIQSTTTRPDYSITLHHSYVSDINRQSSTYRPSYSYSNSDQYGQATTQRPNYGSKPEVSYGSAHSVQFMTYRPNFATKPPNNYDHNSQTTTYRPNYYSKPQVYYGSEQSTTYRPNYSSRPQSSYGSGYFTTSRPQSNYNSDNNLQFTTYKPNSSFRPDSSGHSPSFTTFSPNLYVRPQQHYPTPYRPGNAYTPHSSVFTDVQSLTVYEQTFRPPTVFERTPFSTSQSYNKPYPIYGTTTYRPYTPYSSTHYKPSPSSTQVLYPSRPFPTKYGVTNLGYQSHTTKYPPNRPHIYEPISTTKGTYYLLGGQTLYNTHYHSTKQPTLRPTEVVYQKQVDSGKQSTPTYIDKIVPTENIYSKIDSDLLRQVYEQILKSRNRIEKDGTDDMHADVNKSTENPILTTSYKLYYIDNVFHTLPETQTSPTLDFKTRKPEDDLGPKLFDDGDENFVKISSVQGKTAPSSNRLQDPVYISVQQKDGGLDLYTENRVHNLEKDEKADLLNIEIMPSEINKTEWKIFNETEEVQPVTPVMYINSNDLCSNELPQPINVTWENILPDLP